MFDPDIYEGRGMAFAIPYWCKYFETTQNRNGQQLVRIWNWCDPLIFLAKVHAELLGPSANARHRNGWPYFEIDGELCYYLVGYCPVRFFDDLPDVAIMDSLWLPGMDHTPEYEEICRTEKLDTQGRSFLAKCVSETTYAKLAKSRDFEILRRLHNHIPQVKPIAAKVFDYPWLPD